MSVYAKLLNVQNELKAEKTHYNDFGKYYYRNCEDIMAGAKPLCHAAGLLLTVTDEIEMIGMRYYVKSTATIMDIETGAYHSVTASAREEESKKGMDGSQVTGAASSYARKYALNGLFAIDDTKDADGLPPEPTKPPVKPNTPKANENAPQAQQTQNNGTDNTKPNANQIKVIFGKMHGAGKTNTDVIAYMQQEFGFEKTDRLNMDQYKQVIKWLDTK